MKSGSFLKRRTPLRARSPWRSVQKPMRPGRRSLKRGGSAMSAELRKALGIDPEYSRCAFTGIDHPAGECEGRVTREHALIYAGKKIQKRWAIIPCCAKHHGVDQFQDHGTLVKEMNVWVALNRATDEELLEVSKAVDYIRERSFLNAKYGPYVLPKIPKQ